MTKLSVQKSLCRVIHEAPSSDVRKALQVCFIPTNPPGVSLQIAFIETGEYSMCTHQIQIDMSLLGVIRDARILIYNSLYVAPKAHQAYEKMRAR